MLAFGPLVNGRNVLTINTVKAPGVKVRIKNAFLCSTIFFLNICKGKPEKKQRRSMPDCSNEAER